MSPSNHLRCIKTDAWIFLKCTFCVGKFLNLCAMHRECRKFVRLRSTTVAISSNKPKENCFLFEEQSTLFYQVYLVPSPSYWELGTATARIYVEENVFGCNFYILYF